MGDTDSDPRVHVLDTAKSHVTKDRASAYGQPENNFREIADLWNAYGVSKDGKPIKSHDVAAMMILMKMARLRHNPTHVDSWVDTAGYAACGYHTTVA
jgi:hypothetical protein